MVNIHRAHWELGPLKYEPAKLKGFEVMVETFFAKAIKA